MYKNKRFQIMNKSKNFFRFLIVKNILILLTFSLFLILNCNYLPYIVNAASHSASKIPGYAAKNELIHASNTVTTTYCTHGDLSITNSSSDKITTIEKLECITLYSTLNKIIASTINNIKDHSYYKKSSVTDCINKIFLIGVLSKGNTIYPSLTCKLVGYSY